MQEQCVFRDEKEIERLCVQNQLLAEKEHSVLGGIFSERDGIFVLDVGCNDGSKTVDRFSHDAVSRVVGLEYNEDLVSDARSRFGNEKFSFHTCDVDTNDFPRHLRAIMSENRIDGFDIIYLSLILLNISDPERLLEALRPFLKPDGMLFIIEPNDDISVLNGSREGAFGELLGMIERDRFSGDREVGKHIGEILTACGYEDIIIRHRAVSADAGEKEKKRAIYTMFFSYFPDDVRLLLEEEPNNEEYKCWKAWLERNYDELERTCLSDGSTISIGITILTCRKVG